MTNNTTGGERAKALREVPPAKSRAGGQCAKTLRAIPLVRLTLGAHVTKTLRGLPRSSPANAAQPIKVLRERRPKPGLWGIELAPPPAGVVDDSALIDAGYVDYGATWRRTKATDPTKIVVTNNTPDEYAPSWRQRSAVHPARRDGDSSIARVTNCLAVNDYNAFFVASMYLPDQPRRVDAADIFRWYASEDPAWPIRPALFADAPTWRGHALPIVVRDLPPTQSPDGSDLYVGVPASLEFTITGGRFAFDIGLRPGAPKPGGNGVIRWSDFHDPDVSAPPADLTFADLDDSRIGHFRLVRALRIDY